MISRKSQYVVPQCFDLQDAIKYIDDLKSRIYKAFFEKSRTQADCIQLFCIKSSLVTAIACSKCIRRAGFSARFFELGYLVFCLSNNFYVDATFYRYYSEGCAVDTIDLLKFLINKTKQLVLIWCIEPYQRYLLYKSDLLCCHFGTADSLGSYVDDKTMLYKYALSLNLRSCFSYLYLCALINRLPMQEKIKRYLLEFLDRGIFTYSISCLNLSFDYIVFAKKNKGLACKLLNIFALCTSIEIYTMLDALHAADGSMDAIALIFCDSAILVLHQDSLLIQASIRELKSFLLFNGVKSKDGSFIALSLLRKNSINLEFTMEHNRFYSLFFATRPSLHSQFALIQQISLMLYCSTSQPLFLLIIRLNKLLLLWSNIYVAYTASKTFYLIDYLICLKLKLFAKKRGFALHNLKALVYTKQQYFGHAINSIFRSNCLMFVIISSNDFYKYYSFTRVFWIYKTKCLSS